MANTPVRNMRIDDDLWNAAKAKAEAENTSVTAVIADRLRRYVATPPRTRPTK